MIQDGDVTEAVSVLREVTRTSPNDAEAHLLLGVAVSLIPRRQDSIQALLRDDPDDADMSRALAIVLDQKPQPEEETP